jgi:putative phage-type endonuclease
MKQLDLIPGTPEWHQHRATHFNASDAPAMLGISPHKTRTQLLDELKTGIAPEVDEALQRRFDDGHRFEALARPLAEKIIGRALYPVVCSEGKLSASFDGLTSDDKINFEHKTLNNELRAFFDSLGDYETGVPPDMYLAQIEQQGMIADCERTLFMASKWDEAGDLIEERHCWVERNYDMRQRLMQGWTQFAIDLETHQPKVITERPQAQVSIELPTLFVHAQGAITDSNMEEFGRALTAKLAEVRAIKLETDQDFSNAKESAKLFRDQAKKLKLAKEAMLAQTVTIGEASRMIDAWSEDLNKTALQLEKDVEREDLAKKRTMTAEADVAFAAHVQALEAETRPILLNLNRPNFAEAIKGKRNYTSMHDAIQTLLAQCKSQADAIAQDVRAKLAWCKERAAGYSALFPDLQQIIGMDRMAFEAVIANRIQVHKEAEAEKMAAQLARMEAEAKAKADREAAEKMAAEEQRIRAEERAKAEEEAAARAAAEAEAKAKAEAALQAQEKPAAQPASASITAVNVQASSNFRPTREGMAAVIANAFGVQPSTAEMWLREAFAEVAA